MSTINGYPYTNFHELNLDYWIQRFDEIFTEWAQKKAELEEWQESTEQDLASWKTETLADLNAWETETLEALDAWKTATGADISDWETGVISDLNTWKASFISAYETLEARVTAIVSDTEDMVENLAAPFSSSAAYLSGDYVVQNGVLYKFTADHAAGAWTGSDAVHVTAMADIDDLSSDAYYNEIFANSGKVTLTAGMLENGIWYRGNKQDNANRGRIKRLIPVKAGMKLSIEVLTTAFDVFYGVAATRPWTTYAQGGSTGTWITAAGTTLISITADGFLALMIRNHGADSTPVDCSTFAQAVTIETYLEKTYLTDDLAFIPRGIVPNGTDLNSLRSPGSYVLQSGYSYTNSPLMTGFAGVLLIFRGTANTYSEVVRSIGSPIYSHLYQRSLTLATSNPTFSEWRRIDGDFELLTTGDSTDRTSEVTAALSFLKTLKFGRGTFYLDNISLGSDMEVYGCGPATVLRSVDTNYGALFDMSDRCSIHDLTLEGSDSSQRSDTPTDRNGINFIGSYIYGEGGSGREYGCLDNLRIRNFSGAGVKLSSTGPDIAAHCSISQCVITGCAIGIDIPVSSEYHRISNCAMQRCWWGMINNGGSNLVSCCDFSGNVIGLLMDDTPAGSAVNNSHGDFVGCTFNHSRSAAGVPNKGTAIRLTGIDLGEVFTGCQIYYGALEVSGCTGVRFVGINVGHEVPITLNNNTVITFTDCTFADAPTSADSPVTGSGNVTGTGTVIWSGCYLRSGSAFTPSV